MSLNSPKDNHPSRSPSKSSLRRTSATLNSTRNNPSPGPTTHFAAETTQHHFLPHSPPNQNLEYDDDGDGEEEEKEEVEEAAYTDEASYQAASQPQVPFQPLFTLIEDTVTSEHYHPTVHYLFADDEPDIITEAACRTLEQNSGDLSQGSTSHREQEDSHFESRLPPPRPDVREHYLVLDIAPVPILGRSPQPLVSHRLPSPSPSSVETAQALPKSYPYAVTNAKSLSADWQVFRTIITDAPTMNSEHQNPEEQHLMLRLEGRGSSPDKAYQRQRGETTEDMIERFTTRLAEIRNLMSDTDLTEESKEDFNTAREADMFVQGGLVDTAYQPRGFGNAVLDEQD